MKVYYSDEKLPEDFSNSIFLAGPTPRLSHVKSWRPDALDILKRLEYNGTVFVPERKSWTNFDYVDQIEWEWKALNNCTKIVFWIPRDMVTMLAMTTNVEAGIYFQSGRSVYGRPDHSPNNGYLDYYYKKLYRKAPFNNLEDTLKEAIKDIK
jgi:hypothetical protein